MYFACSLKPGKTRRTLPQRPADETVNTISISPYASTCIAEGHGDLPDVILHDALQAIWAESIQHQPGERRAEPSSDQVTHGQVGHVGADALLAGDAPRLAEQVHDGMEG